jgi:phenylacetic acid degradation protein
MTLYEFEGKRPEVHPDAFVHPEAVIIGGVTLDADCYVGAGAVLRGDWGDIVVAKGSNVQENCVIHARPDEVVRLGPSSHVGHRAILHGCTLCTHVLVGMGAILHDGVVVGDEAVIASGCVLLEGMQVPPGKLVGHLT